MTAQEIKIGQVWRPMIPPLDTGAPRETYSGSDRFVLSIREETRVGFELPQPRLYWTRSEKVKEAWKSIVRASVLTPEKIPASAIPGTAVWIDGFREWIDTYKAELVDDWLAERTIPTSDD